MSVSFAIIPHISLVDLTFCYVCSKTSTAVPATGSSDTGLLTAVLTRNVDWKSYDVILLFV